MSKLHSQILIFSMLSAILALSINGNAQQKYYHLLEIKKYNKLEKKAGKDLSKVSVTDTYHQTMLNHIHALLYSSREFKKYNTEKAYEYMLITQKLYANIIDQKKIEKLQKKRINNISLANDLQTICQKALDDAIEKNTIKNFEYYLDYYLRADLEKRHVATSNRNELAYQSAVNINTVEAFQYFINTYPDAIQIPEAIVNRNHLAFLNAQKINTVESFQSFIDTYPNAIDIPKAIKERDLLAFNSAKEKNTSLAYYNFMKKYPESEQYNKAFSLYEERQFHENTIYNNWLSYKDFLYDFPNNSWTSAAEDSIFQIGKRTDDLTTLEFCVNNFSGTKRNTALLYYYEVFTLDGDLNTIISFYEKHNDYFLMEFKENDIATAELGEQLQLHLPYDYHDNDLYDEYIKKAAPKEKAFVALQRMISPYIKTKKWEEAINMANEYLPLFQERNKKILSLITILEKAYDKTIQIKSVGSRINSSHGKEYSPIISADNKLLYFCGEHRNDNIGGEDIYLSKNTSSGWSRAKMVKELSDSGTNNAPLCVSADGNEILLFDNGDIFSTNKTIEGWENNLKLNYLINTKYWEGDATISSDGNDLIFIRSTQKFEAKYELIFLIDNTGSMQPCINGIKENIRNFISHLKDDELKSVKWNAKIISYKDAISDRDAYYSFPFTNDELSLYNQLARIYAGGGGDEPESTIESLYRAAKETKWDKDEEVIKVIICFTDATNKKQISRKIRSKYGTISTKYLKKQIEKEDINLFLYCQNDPVYSIISDFKNAHVTQYYNAVNQLQNANYSIIMKSLSDKISLLANNVPINHGDRQLNGDIYVSHRDDYGNWSKPISLGNKINTRYSERSPFLHPDMKTLYFSSDGHGGLGKLDVFKSTRLADSCWDCWSEPINLGKEINTIESDWGYKISTDGEKAYFSKKISSNSNEDIYYLNIPTYLRPGFVATISGKLLDKEDQPVAANMRWEDLETKEVIGISKSDPTDGSYFIVLPLGKIYGYFVEDSSFFPLSNNIDLRDSIQPISLEENIAMVTFEQMINEGVAVSVNNLFFEYNKYKLLDYSIPELKRVAKIIIDNELNTEINGHTDNIGNDKFNMELSINRANAVKNFLIKQGVDPTLLKIVGHGETKPIESNDTDKGRAKNRRVEINFIKK